MGAWISNLYTITIWFSPLILDFLVWVWLGFTIFTHCQFFTWCQFFTRCQFFYSVPVSYCVPVFLLTARGLFGEKFLCGCWALSISRKHEIGLDFHPPVPPMFRDVNKSCCWSSLPLTKVRYRWWFHSGVDEKNFTILKTRERLQSHYIFQKSNKPLTAVMIGSSTRKKCIWVSHYVAFPNLQRSSCSWLSPWSWKGRQ